MNDKVLHLASAEQPWSFACWALSISAHTPSISFRGITSFLVARHISSRLFCGSEIIYYIKLPVHFFFEKYLLLLKYLRNNLQEEVRYLHWIHLGYLVQVACCHPMDPSYNWICHHYLLFERRHPIDSSRQKQEQDLYFLAVAIYNFLVCNSVQ